MANEAPPAELVDRERPLVPCPGKSHKMGEGHRCDWCCGAGQVTAKVAWAMSRLEPPT